MTSNHANLEPPLANPAIDSKLHSISSKNPILPSDPLSSLASASHCPSNSSPDLSRPPSLIQLTEAMRLNPDRWQQLKQETDAARLANINPPAAALIIPSQASSPAAPSPASASTTGRLRLPLLSLQRSDSARAAAAAAAASPLTSSPSQQPLAAYCLPSVGGAQPVEPDLSTSDEASATEHQLLLQRRASASDINIGFNRARAPSLAAIQERIARLKPEMTSAAPQPAPPDASAPVPSAAPAHAPPPAPAPAPHTASETPTTAPATPVLLVSQAPLLPPPASPPSNLSTGPTQPGSPALHPLQHSWTLYYDSRTKRPSSNASASATGGQAYEAGLQTIGTFESVEQFCQFFNWTVRPSMMEMHSSVQMFKAGIKPMWEDPANAKGGKWTLTMKTNTSLSALDRLWTYLVLALVGEQVDVHDDVCGAIVATRPRGNRVQVWVREKENVERVNGLGRRLMRVLELTEDSGISLDFTPHSGAFQGASKFISIQAAPSSGTPVRGPPSLSLSPLRPSLEGLGALGRVSGDEKGGTMLRRSTSMDVTQAAGRPSLVMHHSHVGSGFASPPPSAFVGGMPRGPLRASQLSSHDVPIQNGVWRPSTGPPGSLPHVGGAPMMASFGSASGRRPVNGVFSHGGLIGQFQGGHPGPLVSDKGSPQLHSTAGIGGGDRDRLGQTDSSSGLKIVNGGAGAGHHLGGQQRSGGSNGQAAVAQVGILSSGS